MHVTEMLYGTTLSAQGSDAVTTRIGRLALVLLCSLTLQLTGCTITATQKTVDVSPLAVSPNASGDAAVVYVRDISDNREFTVKAQTPATQSVETVDVLTDIETGSMIGQWRTASSEVMADLLLEDGQLVTELVRGSIEEGLRRAGYKVVSGDSARNENAAAIDGRILRFWTYQTGSWTFTFTFEIEVELSGVVPGLEGGRRIATSEYLKSAVAGRPQSFSNTIDVGMEKFMETLANEIRNKHD